MSLFQSHSLSGCGSRASGAAGDHRDGGREGSTLSEDDDEIVHDCTGGELIEYCFETRIRRVLAKG